MISPGITQDRKKRETENSARTPRTNIVPPRRGITLPEAFDLLKHYRVHPQSPRPLPYPDED